MIQTKRLIDWKILCYLESDNLEIQQARNEFQDAMEEELEVWDEVAATQAAVELLDTESAEIQQEKKNV